MYICSTALYVDGVDVATPHTQTIELATIQLLINVEILIGEALAS